MVDLYHSIRQNMLIPYKNFFIGTPWCILGAFKIHIYYLRQKNNVAFFKGKNTIFDIYCKMQSRLVSFHKAKHANPMEHI